MQFDFIKQLNNQYLTFVLPKSILSVESDTVKAVVIDAVNIPDNAIPNTIQKIAKILDIIDLGHLSPYL